jgi:hypothetical protein
LVPTSRIVTSGDRPGVRPTETNPARSNSCRPRETENRERPSSAQSSNASWNSADWSQPAKSQQTDPTWRVLPGSREAGSHQLQGIGPYNGRRFGPASGCGRSKTETASLQPGSRSTASNPASSAVWKPRRADRVEIRNPLAIASRPQRFSDRNRQQRNREAIATRRPAPGSRQADAIQACGTGPLMSGSPGRWRGGRLQVSRIPALSAGSRSWSKSQTSSPRGRVGTAIIFQRQEEEYRVREGGQFRTGPPKIPDGCLRNCAGPLLHFRGDARVRRKVGLSREILSRCAMQLHRGDKVVADFAGVCDLPRSQ